MLDLIIPILELDKLIGISKNIDIAKGVNELPKSVSQGIEQHRREAKWQQ